MGLKIAICQCQPYIGDVGGNVNKITSIVNSIKADLYILPELFMIGYGTDPCKVEGGIPGAIGKLKLLCEERDVALMFGAPFKSEGKMMNSLFFISKDETKRYDKIYLANFGSYDERQYSPGSNPVVCNYKGMRFGLSICYDLFFPEIFRHYAASGVDVNVCISASGTRSREYLETILPARSLENLNYTVFVNNVGMINDLEFYGRSKLVSPLGSILSECSEREEYICVYLDEEVIKNARKERKHLEDLANGPSWGNPHQKDINL